MVNLYLREMVRVNGFYNILTCRCKSRLFTPGNKFAIRNKFLGDYIIKIFFSTKTLSIAEIIPVKCWVSLVI